MMRAASAPAFNPGLAAESGKSPLGKPAEKFACKNRFLFPRQFLHEPSPLKPIHYTSRKL